MIDKSILYLFEKIISKAINRIVINIVCVMSPALKKDNFKSTGYDVTYRIAKPNIINKIPPGIFEFLLDTSNT